MARERTNRTGLTTVVLLVLLWASTAWGDPLRYDVSWTCESGNYCTDLQCWKPNGVLPCNIPDLAIFNVTIPSGSGTITVDCDCDVNDFTLGAGRELRVIHGKIYSIAGQANISGRIYGNRGNFTAPQAAFVDCASQVWVDNGGYVEIGATSYSATDFCADSYYGGSWTWVLFSSSGPATTLKLPSLQRIDAGINCPDTGMVSPNNSTNIERITALDGGAIDVSSVTEIVCPLTPGDYLELNVDGRGSFIDLSFLESLSGNAGNAYLNIRNGGELSIGNMTATVTTSVELTGGSTLRAKSLHTEKSMAISLNDPNDLLDVANDLSLPTAITVSNPGKGMLALSGDYTHTHTDESKVPFDQSYVFINGNGPQELEVGGLDGGASYVLLRKDAQGKPINFGLGQMIIGSHDPNAASGAVLLVDHVDNGNRNAGRAEALYLFGKGGQDGLRISGGSTLYMGGLKVYAMLNGEITDLSTLFGPDEVKIPFDEGWICLGSGPDVDDPRNLIQNGGFETGVNPPTADNPVRDLVAEASDIDHWHVAQDTMNWTHESHFTDAGQGQRFVDLSSETGNGAVSQEVRTVPGKLYHVWFDLSANPYANLLDDAGTRILRVSAAGEAEEFQFDATAQAGTDPGAGVPWPVAWQTKTWHFVASETTTKLTLAAADPNSEYGVAVDNVRVIGDSNDHTLRLFVTDDGMVQVESADSEPMIVSADQSPFHQTFATEEEVTVTALEAYEGHFVRWVGLADSDIVAGNPGSVSISLVMTRDINLTAQFQDLTVQITGVYPADCPVIQSTVIVTDVNGAPITDLTAGDFCVYEDGLLQTLVDVQGSASSVAASLVLDLSGSMVRAGAIADMQLAADQFVSRMRPGDSGEVIKFADVIKVTQMYTEDPCALSAAIWGDATIEPNATTLYDAMYQAIVDTGAQESYGRKAVVALTDGHDTGSHHSSEEVIELAHRLGVGVWTVGLGRGVNEAVLRKIATETGGVYYYAPASDDLETFYQDIAGILKNQYLITYRSTACRPGADAEANHEVTIVITAPSGFGLDTAVFECPAECSPQSHM